VLNVFNSYEQLAGGKHGWIASTNVPTGAPHPPGRDGNRHVLSGWDFNTNTSSATTDGVNHYYFNVTNSAEQCRVHRRGDAGLEPPAKQTNINNLDLFLSTRQQQSCHVQHEPRGQRQHIFVPQFAQGRYDLQVWKAGGTPSATNETYALAWEFFSPSLNDSKIRHEHFNLVAGLSGRICRSSGDQSRFAAAWSTNNPAPVVTNNQNVHSC
jgi:hypothetical protein